MFLFCSVIKSIELTQLTVYYFCLDIFLKDMAGKKYQLSHILSENQTLA